MTADQIRAILLTTTYIATSEHYEASAAILTRLVSVIVDSWTDAEILQLWEDAETTTKEQKRRFWAYGSGPGTLSGSEDI
jgi:hypothetical protein